MKSSILAIATVLTLAAAPLYAQETNVVQNISIRLSGVSQGRAQTNGNFVTTSLDFRRVNNRHVIDALGVATANSFSSMSRLVLVTSLAGGRPSVEVRDGDLKVEVTAFFTLQPLSDSVQSSVLNRRTGRSLATDYYIQRFALQDVEGSPSLGLHFDVNGLAAETSATNFNGRPATELNVEVTGSGDRNGELLILQGSIDVFGRALEVNDNGGTN